MSLSNEPIVYSIYVSPKYIDNKIAFSKQISPIVSMPENDILKIIDNDASFVWLKRKIDSVNVDDIRSISPKQINVLMEEKRVYPNDWLVSDVLGFVGMDSGLAGLEYQFDQFLTGEQGFYVIQGDPRGVRIISSNKTLIAAKDFLGK